MASRDGRAPRTRLAARPGGARLQGMGLQLLFRGGHAALSHLASLADDDDVAEMATVVLDKMLFTMAVNSYAACSAQRMADLHAFHQERVQ